MCVNVPRSRVGFLGCLGKGTGRLHFHSNAVRPAAQAEDDIIVTLNHMLLFREESELLDGRRHSDGAPLANSAVPGFIRVEYVAGEEGTIAGPSSGEEWQEWEVMLSRCDVTEKEVMSTYHGCTSSRSFLLGIM